MNITFLGTGTSDGVPVIGCDCDVCRSKNKHDNRFRSSLWIQGTRGNSGGESVLIDVGPEFRLQALRAGIRNIDALLITHSHADHVHGLDDVRPMSFTKPIPIYANSQTLDDLKERFSYIFRETQKGGGKPRIELHAVSQSFKIEGLEITPIPLKHGELNIFGWKITEAEKSVVYITDTSKIPLESETLIGKPDILIIGALRIKTHPTHFNFDEAMEAALKIGAESVYFTHIAHNFSHEWIKSYFQGILRERNICNIIAEPAFDELSLTI
jgi:phosphoribosyl 1,2-cyclic phosphate phosphodiesterase